MEIKSNYSTSQTSSSQDQRQQKNDYTFKQALENFFIIHQRSQITGVPTREYDTALESIGMQKGDNLKAIHLLEEYGYDTAAPSIEAITKYGNTNQDHGNHSYMKNEDIEKKKLLTTSEKLSDNDVNAETVSEQVVDDKPYNYFDAATKLSKIISDDEKQQSLPKLLKNEESTENTDTFNSTDDLLKLAEEFIYTRTSQRNMESSLLSKLLTS